MRRLIRFAPLAVFAVGVVIGPAGFAGAQVPEPGVTTACAPVPQCELPAVEENAANVGDNADKYGGERGYDCLESWSISAWGLADTEAGSVTPATVAACNPSSGNSGTTYYKPYGGAESGTPATGNFNHKYDNEEHVVHCGGFNDDDCNNEVYMTNSSGNHSFYHDYSQGRGWTGFSFPRTAGRPFCQVDADPHGGKIRNECYYVYG